MASFSERHGYTPKKALQLESMDDDLRIGLFNVIYDTYLFGGLDYHQLWSRFFKQPLNELHKRRIGEIPDSVKDLIEVTCRDSVWYKVYDLVEYISSVEEDVLIASNFEQKCNTVLEREKSAYRLLKGQIVPISSDAELSEIEKAIDALFPVQIHLQRALELFSDRENPDYRNSIKESISAVEAICNCILGTQGKTLGEALKEIENNTSITLHPAKKKAFLALYGYTSDSGGIRHGLSNKDIPADEEDAYFMLVTCSAFINYLKVKASKAGITL